MDPMLEKRTNDWIWGSAFKKWEKEEMAIKESGESQMKPYKKTVSQEPVEEEPFKESRRPGLQDVDNEPEEEDAVTQGNPRDAASPDGM